ncbi:flagellar basal body P-ring formation chaperone FlgA [Pragia fontium]|uniref:Flagella basal body P-ring formation protein FlgA n=1 Tax=Pragia fontium DSM 5563 = ATCC 49100 TaxID=1122977 RepID=A0AAJ4W7R1_9GAMM|nr:flagella basal body P-ring formation protein FlgA [Pragia fontium DSM 5563 = ATCC 49100]
MPSLKGKACFLPKRKKADSANRFLFSTFITFSLVLYIVAMASSASAAPSSNSARKQVYALAVEQAGSDIAQIAKRKGWKGYNSKVNVFIPNDVSRNKACRTPLKASSPAGNKMELSRLRYDIRCEDGSGWEVAVTVKPDIYLPVLVAKNTIERGEKITAGDIEMKKRNISSSRNGFISNPDEAVGLTVKRRIRPLQPIIPSQLEQPILVNRGQRVIMIASQDGIEARTMGEAMKNGRKGDMIKVKNLSSKKVVTAVVDGMGVVRMLYAPGQ